MPGFSVEAGSRPYMKTDEDQNITLEQIHKRDLENRRKDYWEHGGTVATGLSDDEFKYVTGLPLSKPKPEGEEDEVVQVVETKETSKTALDRVREWLSSLKPNTPQRNPV